MKKSSIGMKKKAGYIYPKMELKEVVMVGEKVDIL